MRKGTLFIASIFLVGLIYLYYLVTQIPPNILDTHTGPELMPKIYIIAGLAITVLLLIQTIRDKTQVVSEENEQDEKIKMNLVYYLGLLILYVLAISFVGYYIATFLVILVLLIIKKVKNIVLLIAVPVVFNLFIFILFDFVIGLPIP